MILLTNANAKHIPLADDSVNCVVTSPPYYGLRDYGTAEWVGGDPECDHKVGRFEYPISGKQASNSGSAGHQAKEVCHKCGAIRVDKQIGLEQSPDDYVEAMCQVFDEIWRVLRDDGTVWLNLGDSYAGGGGASGHTAETTNCGRRTSTYGAIATGGKTYGLKPKDLIGIPWRVAFALQARDWYLRQDIIWHKPNPMPESVKDRCTKAHEYIFLLTKSARYWYDNEAIATPSIWADKDKRADGTGIHLSNGKSQSGEYAINGTSYGKPNNDGMFTRNKRSVWTVTTKSYPGSHYAVFPPDLIEPCILAGCPEGGLVLDPFVGSGTTCMVARKHRRNAIGLDLNFEYLTTNARERLQYGGYVPVADGIKQLTLEA